MDFDAAIEMIKNASRILVTSHTRPDGDAIGSIISLSRSIKAQAEHDGREIVCQRLLLSYAGDSYKFMLDGTEWVLGENITEEQINTTVLDGFDLIIVVDTRSARQLTVIGDYLVARTAAGKPVLVLDHHVSGDAIGTCQLIDVQAAAAGELVYRLARAGNLPVDCQSAQAAFVAISCDTGWFRFQNTSADSFMIASELIRCGVEVDTIYQKLFQNHDPAKIFLMSQALQTLKLYCDGKFAFMTITNDTLAKCGADRSHIENIVNEPMQIGSVEVSIMCVEMEEPGKTRFSLRSKNYIDVNAIANSMGGGGHVRAAGLTVHEPLQIASEIVIKAVEDEIKNR